MCWLTQGFNSLLYLRITADDGDRIPFLQQLHRQGFTDMTEGAGEYNLHVFPFLLLQSFAAAKKGLCPNQLLL